MIQPNNYTWNQITPNGVVAGDGKAGMYFQRTGLHHTIFNWTDGGQSSKIQSSSPDLITWTAGADIPCDFGKHTIAGVYVESSDLYYYCQGDIYNQTNDSWVFNGITHTNITNSNGLPSNFLGALSYDPITGFFYYTGGHTAEVNSRFPVTAATYKSEDALASFSFLANTPFDDGLTWGSIQYYNGYHYKIMGGKYDSSLPYKTYPRNVYRTLDFITWQFVSEIPQNMRAKTYIQLVVFDGLLWIICGAQGIPIIRGSINTSSVWAFNGTEFARQTTILPGRHAETCYPVSDGIILISGTGGANSEIPFLDVWKMTKN